MSDRLDADQPSALLPFLFERLRGWSRSNVKKRLAAGCVRVDGEVVTDHAFALVAGSRVEVLPLPSTPTRPPTKLTILYEDDDLVAIDKQPGLLAVSAKPGDTHALALLREHLSGPRRRADLWPVHRLDRDTSGVMLFARSRRVCDRVKDAWSEAEKVYHGVVEGHPAPPSRTVDLPLRMDERGMRVLVGTHPDAKHAVTRFGTLETSATRALLEVRPETGRQHQIRAHLAAIGHPIVGDERYGTADLRMGLHALRLEIPSPRGRERLTFVAPTPKVFARLLAGPAAR